tara:strand:- start:845 stop:1156 length:312 start_codon:yes stop_codon:yes gene_type:complete
VETKFDKLDSKNKIFCSKLLEERLKYVNRVRRHFDLSMNEVMSFSLNFIFSNTNVNVVIPAASDIRQLEAYIKIFNSEKRFGESEINEIVKFVKSENMAYSLS